MAKDEKISAIAALTFPQLQECLALGASLEQINLLAEGGYQYAQIKDLAATLGAAKSQGAGLSGSDLKEILKDQRKAMRPENDRHPEISVFSYPEGNLAHPKPPLSRTVFFNGTREREDALSALEVELYNRFDTDRTAREGMWRARIVRNGSEEELHIVTEPKTLDGRQSLPPLTQLLRELRDGAEAANPDLLAAQVERMKAQIAELMAKTATAA